MGVQVISFKCLLKNKLGQVISTTYNREVITVSSDKTPLLPGLAKGLQNLKKGEKRKILLLAEEAYGLYDPKKVIFFPRNRIPKHHLVGESITIVGKSGKNRSYRILKFHDDLVSLDGNHPLAGQDLTFEIEALDARDATHQEIADTVPDSDQLLH